MEGLTFVAEHESNCEKSKLAAGTALDGGIGHFESVNEEESEKDDVLGDLGGGENGSDPLGKGDGWAGLLDEWAGEVAKGVGR